MIRRNPALVWIGIVLLSGMFLLGQEAWPPPPERPFVLTQTLAEFEPESSALLDLDDDGALDILLAANPRIAYARNIGGGQFQPVTSWGVERAKGFGLHDFNLDGRLDPFVAQPPESDGSGPPNGPDCAINNGNETLTYQDLGNNAICRQRTVVFDDFDGDGWLDALHPTSSFSENHFWSELHRGLPGGLFDPVNSIDTDMPAPFWHEYVDTCPGAEGQWANAWMKGAVIRDFDQDGRADVVMVAWADAGYADPRCRDAHKEFVNQRSYRGIFVLRNVSTPGDIQFQDVSHAAIGPHAYGNAYGDWEFYAAVPFDYDLDGDLDLFVGGLTKEDEDNPTLLLLRNDSAPGTIAFTDVTATAGALNDINNLPAAERAEIRFSDGAPIDYDNDGLVDMAFTNRHDSGIGSGGRFVYLFRNLGNGDFSLLDGTQSGLTHLSNALNFGDLDQDGRLDLVVHDKFTTGATYVYRNAATDANHWIQLDVRDSETGTYAFGARVTVYQAGTSTVLGTDEVRTDYSYRSKRTPVLHFGLGSTESVDVRVVRPHEAGEAWFYGLGADTRHTLD